MVLLTLLPAAVAASQPPAGHQYTESVPPAGGDRGTEAPADEQAKELPDDVEQQVQTQGEADAEALEEVATSPALGAPETHEQSAPNADEQSAPKANKKKDDQKKPDKASKVRVESEQPTPVRTAATAPAEGDDPTMTILLVALGVLSAIAAGVALARRRSQPR